MRTVALALAVASASCGALQPSAPTGGAPPAAGVVATVPLEGMPRDVVLSPDGTRAYVSTSSPDAVVVLDTRVLVSAPTAP